MSITLVDGTDSLLGSFHKWASSSGPQPTHSQAWPAGLRVPACAQGPLASHSAIHPAALAGAPLRPEAPPDPLVASCREIQTYAGEVFHHHGIRLRLGARWGA